MRDRIPIDHKLVAEAISIPELTPGLWVLISIRADEQERVMCHGPENVRTLKNRFTIRAVNDTMAFSYESGCWAVDPEEILQHPVLIPPAQWLTPNNI